MATITKLEQQFRDNKPNGFKISLDDGTQGYLDERNSDKGLREGDAVEVTVVIPEGKTYKKISAKRGGTPSPLPAPPMPTQTQPQQSVVKPPNTSAIHTAKSFSEMKFEGRIVCIKLAVECILQGKFEKPEAMEAFAEWVTVLDASIDELKSK